MTEADDDGSTTTAAVDPDTGLEFSVYFSSFGDSSSLQVELTDATAEEAREAVVGSPVAIYCDVPGQDVQYFPQRWKDGEDHVGSALLPEEPTTNVATDAESCGLSLADTDDPKVFDEEPFSEVELK